MIDHFYVVVRNKLWNLIEPIVNGRELPGPRQCGNLDILTIFFSFVQIIGGLCLVMTVCPTRGFLESLVKLNGNDGVYVLIIVSALLVVTGIVGWIGLFHRSRSVLGSFTVLLLFSLAAGTIGGIWTFIKASETDTTSVDRVRNIVLYDYGRDASKTSILDIVQQSFQCCGSEDYTSWASSMFSRTELNESINAADNIFAVPQSCCIDPLSETCQQNRNITTNLHVEDFIHIQALFPFFFFSIRCSSSWSFLSLSLSFHSKNLLSTIIGMRFEIARWLCSIREIQSTDQHLC